MPLKKYSFFMLMLICFNTSIGTSFAADVEAVNLMHIQGCKGCHTLDDSGGTLGPVLDGVGNRLTPRQLRQKLINPKKSAPTSRMPDYRHLTTAELELLIEYLSSLR